MGAVTKIVNQLRPTVEQYAPQALGLVAGVPGLGQLGAGPLSGATSQIVDNVLGSLANTVAKIVPQAQLADSAKVNQAIDQIVASYPEYKEAAATFKDRAGYSLGQFTQQMVAANQQQGRTQDLIDMAKGATQNIGSNALSTLQGAAEGNAPSAAQMQLRAGLDEVTRQQQAMANSGPVGGMVLRQKEAMMNSAMASQQAANQAAQLRAQEMATARGQYGQQALGQVGAEQNLASLSNAATAQASNLAQQQANIYGQSAQAQQTAQALGQQAMQTTGQLAAQKQATEQQAYNTRQQALGQALGGVLNAGGAVAGSLIEGGSKIASSGIGAAGGTPAAAEGGVVPGKAKEEGNDYENDFVKIFASPGEIVIPLSHSGSLKDAVSYLSNVMKDKKAHTINSFLKHVEDGEDEVYKNGKKVKDASQCEDMDEDEDDLENILSQLIKKKKAGK